MTLEETSMRPKYFLMTITAALALLCGAIAASAQTAELRGHVILRQADGKSERVANAIIDVYRTDIAGKYNTKTDKKGNFVFAGLPFGGTYTIAVSAPNVSPTFQPGARAGKDVDYELEVTPGDGKRLTEAEVKAAASTAQPGAAVESAADKAKREEIMRKNAEIEEKNKKISSTNETIARTFKAGNDALMAKNYDEAIKQYSEGLSADAEQPALLTNMALAYKARGVDRYNAAVTSKDDAAKASGLEGAKDDFRKAADATGKAVAFIKAQPAAADPTAQARQNSNKMAAFSTHAEAMRLLVTKVDQSKADAGLVAYQEYIAIETDPAKKAKAQKDAAQMLLDSGAGDKALVEFQKILADNPNDPDANLGAGLALFSSGDKAKYQDAANYLQKFVDAAPETHKFKADAKAILTELKNTEKVVPQNTGRGRRKG
jgi:tetratricopeptide (TPR) repeat protein